MRFISSTTRIFYNLLLPDAQDPGHGQEKGGGPESPRPYTSVSYPCYSLWLRKSRYKSVSSEVSAAAMYVKAAAVSTRRVPPASRAERMP